MPTSTTYYPTVAAGPGGHVLVAFAEPAHSGDDLGARRLVLARATTP